MKLFRRPGWKIAILSAALVAGCTTVSPPAPITKRELPAAWSEPVLAGSKVWPDAKWWQQFRSEELDFLISEGQSGNLDLAAAADRVLQAGAQADIARAALFPSLELGALVQNQGALGNLPVPGNTLFGLAGQAAYELDFWGLARDNVRAAEALLKSARYAQETVALTVYSDIASNYFKILALRERINVASENLATAQRIVDAIQVRTREGLSSPLDLAQQQALAAGQAAVIPALQQQEQQTVFTLGSLLGRVPEGFAIAAKDLVGIAVPGVSPGLPSELVVRRPDIAQVEANLSAANANVAAARAAFFPVLSLGASAALARGAVPAASNLAAGELSTPGGTGLIYTAGASLLQTIFDGGRRQGQLDLAKAQQDELIANYRNTVFKAFSDVESALNEAARLADQERLKSEQVEKARTAFDISDVQYREGLIDLLALLQTQQTLFGAQDELLQVRFARLEAVVGLYRALGGGWTETEEPPSK